MSDFTEFARDLLTRLNVPQKCVHCGNDNLEELAITGFGRIICRQDVENIRQACTSKRDGWRVLAPDGRVVNSGPGITLRPTSILAE
jgi:hypothetical protein